MNFTPSRLVLLLTVTIVILTIAVVPACAQTCFKPGGNLQIIHDFTDKEAGNYDASGVTIDQTGNLYGQSGASGDYGEGLVYELAPENDGWIFSPLYSFPGGDNGNGPSGVIVGPNRSLYGGASGGLQNCNNGRYCGLVFSLSPQPTACLTNLCSWWENVLYRFTGRNDAWNGVITASDEAGNLYGVSAYGGAQGYGAVFELTPAAGGWTETILYTFPGGSDGAYPNSLLVGADGSLYGGAGGGGAGGQGYGVAFRLVPSGSGWAYQVIHTFTEAEGYGIGNLVQDSSGNLYGTGAQLGQPYPTAYVLVFMLSPSNGTWTLTVISVQGQENWQGSLNTNLAIDAAGNLYGSTYFWSFASPGHNCNRDTRPDCGENFYEYIFKLARQGDYWVLSTPAYFGNNTEFPNVGALAVDVEGNLYGTTTFCGKYGYGTVWELSP